MATPENFMTSVSIPIFSGSTTGNEFRQWQLLIRDYAGQLELENFLLQEIRYPGAADDIRNIDPAIFRPLTKPEFPPDTATGDQIKFYELRLCITPV